MPIEVLVWVLPLTCSLLIGLLQIYYNRKNVEERAQAQNVGDNANAIKSLTDANSTLSKDLAEQKNYSRGLEDRIRSLEIVTGKQKIRIIMDLDMNEKPRVGNVIVERIVTGPLVEKV